jgi:hypothetical protein
VDIRDAYLGLEFSTHSFSCKVSAMLQPNNRATIVSMAVLASATATLLHEGLGHGVTAWLRGDIVTELTSNHLSSLRPDRWVAAGGTIVNLIAGTASLIASRCAGNRANTRYFLWLLAALNLFPGAGYFMLSGIFGFGDWFEVIRGFPHQFALRTGMAVGGVLLYILVARLLAVAIRPYVPDRKTYNTVGRLPYYTAGLFSCAAGLLDPLGLQLLLVSTIPAAFGGSSGLIWADNLMSRKIPEQILVVRRQPGWWVLAIILGASYIFFLGRGIHFAH